MLATKKMGEKPLLSTLTTKGGKGKKSGDSRLLLKNVGGESHRFIDRKRRWAVLPQS